MINELKDRLEAIRTRLKIEEKKKLVNRLELESGQPSFWQNPETARKSMRELKTYKGELTAVEDLELRIMLLVETPPEQSVEERAVITKDLRELEIKTYLSGPHDFSDAVLSIHSGQGGVEAMDWASMLKRMYRRYAESRGWQWVEIDEVAGEEAGIKSSVIEISGPYAYGFLHGERGVHRLVRQSPFNADHLRQTSFAMVELIPLLDENLTELINPKELEIETYRSSGHGGQNVQKVETAVRIKHVPTGITVTCQAERSQNQNRERALHLLQSKLMARREEEERAERATLKGEHKVPGWGNQIRSYVLHPYKMVKDLRTEVESGNPDGVLGGDLDQFIEAELRVGL